MKEKYLVALEEIQNAINSNGSIDTGDISWDSLKNVLELVKEQEQKIKELDLIKIKGKKYVSKDKIKEKIEEYNKMINATYADLTYYADYRRDVCHEIKNVLQVLLEEE